MAVADVFTALTEDRPYREGMEAERTFEVLGQMAESAVLDPRIVSLLEAHFEEVNSSRIASQRASAESYQIFARSIEQYLG